MVTIEPLALVPVRAVARGMRDADRREIFALRFDDDADRLAKEACLFSRFGAVACWDGAPVAVLGAAEATPGVFEVWLFATDAWPEVAVTVARWVLQVLKPALLAAGGHRAQCLSLAERHDAHRLLEHLGFVREATLKERGRAREDFHLYAWRIADVRTAVQPAQAVLHAAAAA
jgi:hypothetical protein